MNRLSLEKVRPRRWSRAIACLWGWAMGACCFVAVGSAETLEASATAGAPDALSLPGSALARPAWDGGAQLASMTDAAPYARRWQRPRERQFARRSGNQGPNGWLTVRGGFFDADGVPENDWLVGLKATAAMASNLEIGVSADLQRRSDAERSRVEEFRDPAGNLVRTTVTTFETSSNLIPILGVIEMRFPATGIQPYIGLGAGYQVLVVDGTDFATRTEFSDSFGGFGWQGHAGIRFPLGPRTRLIGEGFWNRATVNRTVRDLTTGERVKEEIDVNGGGMRVGLGFAL